MRRRRLFPPLGVDAAALLVVGLSLALALFRATVLSSWRSITANPELNTALLFAHPDKEN